MSSFKQLFEWYGIYGDLVAGLTVACVSVPLNLAVASASGVQPSRGLVSGAVGAIVGSLFGGTPLLIRGPASAMSAFLAALVLEKGVKVLPTIGLICGCLQILGGILGLGTWSRLIPISVASGFAAGISFVIAVDQLPSTLGLSFPKHQTVLNTLSMVRKNWSKVDPLSIQFALFTAAMVIVLPKLSKRVPWNLLAILIPSFIANYYKLDLFSLPRVPDSAFKGTDFPHLDSLRANNDILGWSLIACILTSFESLLAAKAITRIANVTTMNPDRELVGQGICNIVSAAVGGIPVSGVVMRSELNINSGAKTRRASLIAGLFLLMVVLKGSSFLQFEIPVVVLSTVLVCGSARLFVGELYMLFKSPMVENSIFFITFVTVVFVDKIVGVHAGIAATLVLLMFRLLRTRSEFKGVDTRGPATLSINGSISFLSSYPIESIRSKIMSLNAERGVVLDFSEISFMDDAGADLITKLLKDLKTSKVVFALRGLDQHHVRLLKSTTEGASIEGTVARNESDVLKILNQDSPADVLGRLVYGVGKFNQKHKDEYGSLFERLAKGQSPHTLFITCSDSRIDPSLITSTDPGELFVVRNVGNCVPAYNVNGNGAEGAAIEYAVGILKVKHIIICGHSACGAMNAILAGDLFKAEQMSAYPCLSHWLEVNKEMKDNTQANTSAEDAARFNARHQVENLLSYPMIKKRLINKDLYLHAWMYDIGHGELNEYDEKKKTYVGLSMLQPADASMAPLATTPSHSYGDVTL